MSMRVEFLSPQLWKSLVGIFLYTCLPDPASVCPSQFVYLPTFIQSSILKFHLLILHEKVADPYYFLVRVIPILELWPFDYDKVVIFLTLTIKKVLSIVLLFSKLVLAEVEKSLF